MGGLDDIAIQDVATEINIDWARRTNGGSKRCDKNISSNGFFILEVMYPPTSVHPSTPIRIKTYSHTQSEEELLRMVKSEIEKACAANAPFKIKYFSFGNAPKYLLALNSKIEEIIAVCEAERTVQGNVYASQETKETALVY